MLRLILMRHAKSSWDQIGLDDYERPLNARGRQAASAMGDWLRSKNHLPDWALVSSSKRTRETFDQLGLSCQVAYLDGLYHASPDAMLAALRLAHATNVLMIGHNPGIAIFANQIVRTPIDHLRAQDFPTCATLVTDIQRVSWKDVSWGDGQVVDFRIPREITG